MTRLTEHHTWWGWPSTTHDVADLAPYMMRLTLNHTWWGWPSTTHDEAELVPHMTRLTQHYTWWGRHSIIHVEVHLESYMMWLMIDDKYDLESNIMILTQKHTWRSWCSTILTLVMRRGRSYLYARRENTQTTAWMNHVPQFLFLQDTKPRRKPKLHTHTHHLWILISLVIDKNHVTQFWFSLILLIPTLFII